MSGPDVVQFIWSELKRFMGPEIRIVRCRGKGAEKGSYIPCRFNTFEICRRLK